MRKWCVHVNNEVAGAWIDTTPYPSKEEALEAADGMWDRLTKLEKKKLLEFYVGMFDIDEDGLPTDCWEVAKEYIERKF